MAFIHFDSLSSPRLEGGKQEHCRHGTDL